MSVFYDFNIHLFLLSVPRENILYFLFLSLSTQYMLNKKHVISFQDEESRAA